MSMRLAVVLVVVLVLTPLSGAAQPAGKPARVGVLLLGTPDNDPNFAAFRKAMQELGHVEGRTLVFEYRFAQGKPDRLPALARELVALKPDVIFAVGGDVTPAARTATTTIPLVMVVSNDPVPAGLVTTLARPGGNLTGVTLVSSDLAAKRVQLLKEIAPAVSRIGVLWNPDHIDPEYRETQAAGRALSIAVQSLEVRSPADFDDAFQVAAAGRLEAIVVVSSRLMLLNRQLIVDLASRHRLLLATGWGGWPQIGALFSYGPDIEATTRLAAKQVDKILKGARPGDLPVEQPTKFELVINLKTAKAHGLTIAPAVLARADKLIE